MAAFGAPLVPRGRPGAGGPLRAGRPGGDHGANGPSALDWVAGGHHRRGGGRRRPAPAERGRGRRRGQHRRPARGGRAGRRRAGRRGDLPGHPGGCSTTSRCPRSGSRARPSRCRCGWRASARGRLGVVVAQGPATPFIGREAELGQLQRSYAQGPGRGLGAAGHRRRRARGRQEPAGPRAPGVRRRPARAGRLAAGPLPALRRGHQLLGPRGDRQGPGRHPGVRRPGRRPRPSWPGRSRPLVEEPAERQWLETRLAPLLGLASDWPAGRGRRSGRRRSPPGGASSRPWRPGGRWSWSSRTCTGPTTPCWTSSSYLVEWPGGVPLLVVATTRPELFDRDPGWGRRPARRRPRRRARPAVGRRHRPPDRGPARPGRCCPTGPTPPCSAAPAATRCTPRSSAACWPTRACWSASDRTVRLTAAETSCPSRSRR